jgi:two-component system, LytTR family, response regulator
MSQSSPMSAAQRTDPPSAPPARSSGSATIRTLIVDDEPFARQRLRELCALEHDIELIGECEHGNKAVRQAQALKPDLVLLDVQMRGVNGFDVLERLTDHVPLVVFVTAYEEYASDAFDVHAVDYLVKPFDRARFQQALDRVRQRLADESGRELRTGIASAVREAMHSVGNGMSTPVKRIVADKDDRIVFIDPADIDCIEASRNYVCIRVGKESYRLRCTMQQAEQMLDQSRFLRIHRSIIINTLKIKEMERWFHGEYVITLASGQRFTSGRVYRQQIQTHLRNGIK